MPYKTLKVITLIVIVCSIYFFVSCLEEDSNTNEEVLENSSGNEQQANDNNHEWSNAAWVAPYISSDGKSLLEIFLKRKVNLVFYNFGSIKINDNTEAFIDYNEGLSIDANILNSFRDNGIKVHAYINMSPEIGKNFFENSYVDLLIENIVSEFSNKLIDNYYNFDGIHLDIEGFENVYANNEGKFIILIEKISALCKNNSYELSVALPILNNSPDSIDEKYYSLTVEGYENISQYVKSIAIMAYNLSNDKYDNYVSEIENSLTQIINSNSFNSNCNLYIGVCEVNKELHMFDGSLSVDYYKNWESAKYIRNIVLNNGYKSCIKGLSMWYVFSAIDPPETSWGDFYPLNGTIDPGFLGAIWTKDESSDNFNQVLGANIKLTNNKDVLLTATSDMEGEFFIPINDPRGQCKITITADNMITLSEYVILNTDITTRMFIMENDSTVNEDTPINVGDDSDTTIDDEYLHPDEQVEEDNTEQEIVVPVIKITYPVNEYSLSKRHISVNGTVEGLKPGTVLDIYVRTNTDHYQGSTTILDDMTWFYPNAYIGTVDEADTTGYIYAAGNGITSNEVKVNRSAYLWITDPDKGDSVDREIIVSGNSHGFSKNDSINIQVIVNDISYPQDDAIVQEDGTWSQTVFIGAVDDYEYFEADIIAETCNDVSDKITVNRGQSITIKIPDNWDYVSREVPVSGSSKGINSGEKLEVIVITNDEYPQTAPIVDSSGNWSTTVVIGSVSDTYVNADIVVKNIDNTISRSINVIRDPEIYITSPTYGSYVNRILTVSGTAQSLDGQEIELFVDTNQPWSQGKTLVQNGEWSCTVYVGAEGESGFSAYICAVSPEGVYSNTVKVKR